MKVVLPQKPLHLASNRLIITEKRYKRRAPMETVTAGSSTIKEILSRIVEKSLNKGQNQCEWGAIQYRVVKIWLVRALRRVIQLSRLMLDYSE